MGLPGLAKYFKASSDEERDHAQLLIDYQVGVGGWVGGGETEEEEGKQKGGGNKGVWLWDLNVGTRTGGVLYICMSRRFISLYMYIYIFLFIAFAVHW